MKSGKQRRLEIRNRRAKRGARLRERELQQKIRPLERAPVNVEALASYKSYGTPAFVMRGYYQNIPFRCQGCGKDEIWTAMQQKWWYEVAKGYVYSTASLCRPCRKKEQARRTEARRVHLEGIERKKHSKQHR